MQTGSMMILSAYAGINIEDLTNQAVLNALTLSNWFSDTLRSIGSFIFWLIAGLVDYIGTTFTEIMAVDFSKTVSLGTFEATLNDLCWYLLTIVTLITVLSLPFRKNRDFSIFKYMIISIFAITFYSQFCTYIDDVRAQGIVIVDKTFSKDDLSVSEMVFYGNSHDMLKSIKSDELKGISRKIPVRGVDYNETLSKHDLQGHIEYDDEGKKTIDDLDDGVWNSGFNEERYYRYDVSYFIINTTLVVIGIFLIISAIKVGYILVKLFYTKLFGAVVMSTSISKTDKIKKVFSEVINSTVALLLVYVGVMLMYKIVPTVLAMNVNWITKVILMAVMCFAFLFGDTFAIFAGVDTGGQFLIRSVFMSRGLFRGASKVAKGVGHSLRSGYGKLKESGMLNKYVPDFSKVEKMPKFATPLHQPDTPEGQTKVYGLGNETGEGLPNRDMDGAPLYGSNDGTPPFYGNPTKKYEDFKHGVTTPEISNTDTPLIEELQPTPAPESPKPEDKDKKAKKLEQPKKEFKTEKPKYRKAKWNEAPDGKQVKTYEEYKRGFLLHGDTDPFKPLPKKAVDNDMTKLISKEFGFDLTNNEKMAVNGWQEKYGDEMTKLALRESLVYDHKNLGYVNNVLRAWNSKGFNADDIKNGKQREEEYNSRTYEQDLYMEEGVEFNHE